MPTLQKYGGRSTRYTCPNCKRDHCFTRYLDDNGEEIDPTCGICDHTSACGYHLPPREFYKLHPERKPGPDWRYQKVDWLEAKKQKTKVLPVATCFIPPDIVLRSVKPERHSDFVTFLLTILDPIIVEDLVNDYQLGVTSKKDVIFFQLDIGGSCRTGKIMKYDPETGHRIKDENCPGRITWVHSLMKYPNGLPEGWQLTQCLFGEHLLRQYPNKVVALVESEKTALIGSGFCPQYIWLATGGKTQLGSKLDVLQDRKVLVFPDIDAHDAWVEAFAKMPYLNVTFSGILQQECTPEDRAAQIDIADWLLRWRSNCRVPSVPPVPSTPGTEQYTNPVAREVAKYFPANVMPELAALIEDLDLELVSVTQIKNQ